MKILQILKEVTSEKPKKIELMYTETGRFYAMRVNGSKIGFKQASEMIENLIGSELPHKAFYSQDSVLGIVNALEKQGIEADSFEIDRS